MNREFLSSIYNHLGCLNFSVLPKMVKQKQTSITSNSNPSDIVWNKFLQSFGNLSNCEFSYYKFTYLSVKTNNLQDSYITILNELRITCNLNKSNTNNNNNAITSPTFLNNNGPTTSPTTTPTPTITTPSPTTPTKSTSSFTFASLLRSPTSQQQQQQQQQQQPKPLTQQQIDDQNSENSFFLTLIQQTCVILQVRVEMVGIYQSLLQLLINQDLNIETIENALDSIPTIYKDKITHPLLIQIKTNINYEISILKNLLKAHTLVSKHEFKDSVLLLYKSKIELDQWRETENGLHSTGTSHKHSSSSSSSSSNHHHNERWASNHIHQWLSMFHNSILSKSTLYFHFPLLNVEEEIGGSPSSFKEIYQKNSPDYISIIENFCTKNGVLFFGLIFEAKDRKYNKTGYSFIEPESVGGMGAFPLLFYYPLDKSPMQHLPNIIGLIMQNYQSLERPNDILYYLDCRKVKDTGYRNNETGINGGGSTNSGFGVGGSNSSSSSSYNSAVGGSSGLKVTTTYDEYITYFISRVEQQGVLVSIIFKDIKKQKDQHINEFLKLLINSLRMNDVISILRQKDQSK
ncbi:hypothetical protein RB653_004575 [Dictyostelium firmibasis]|uniref:Uncharacterized protein n=1 Tax=Dictyostelium firmibasis TaxID=79012 RepID=A0AAN7U807_9MYCE